MLLSHIPTDGTRVRVTEDLYATQVCTSTRYYNNIYHNILFDNRFIIHYKIIL